MEDIYKPPESNLVVEKMAGEKELFSVSMKKLYVMYFFTFGLYSCVFFYENWKILKYKYNLNVNPELRSILQIFFTHSLFKRIKNIAEKKGIHCEMGYMALASLYVIFALLSHVASKITRASDDYTGFDLLSLVFIFMALYPLIVVQEVALKVNGEHGGESNSKFTVYNWLFIVLGAVLWVGTFIGIYTYFFPQENV